jgi:hypothetical protein
MTPSHKTLYYKNTAVFNAIGYIMVIGVNILASLSLINNESPREIAEKYESLFTPAGYTFSIWGLIYLGLLGFIVYQCWLAFSGRAPEALAQFMERMRGWWLISCLANTCWLFSWHYELLPVSLLLMLGLLISLLAIHVNFNIYTAQASLPEKLFISIPFSIYLGWICVAAVANLSALLVYTGFDGRNIPVTMFFIAVCTAAIAMLIIKRNNFVAGLTAIWALSGIIIKRQEIGGDAETPIVITCITAIAVLIGVGCWHKIVHK